jgi:hypothetical protein
MMCAGVTAHGEILKGDLVSAGEAGRPHIANPLLGVLRNEYRHLWYLRLTKRTGGHSETVEGCKVY